MEVLVLVVQLLSLALVIFGAWLCVGFVQREREDAEAQRQKQLPPTIPENAPAELPPSSDVGHGTPA